MRLLLVEDDPMIAESLEEALRGAGYALDCVADGKSAMLAVSHHAYDLILLDLGLPKQSGIDVLRLYRRQGGDSPVLIITARDATHDRVAGLDSGADDYLVKPFDVDELFARIRALLRRKGGRRAPEVTYGDLTLNPATREASYKGNPVALSTREFAMLQTLIDCAGTLVSKSELEEKLYGWGEEIESNTVAVYIHMLRKKLGNDLITTVRGAGYMLTRPT
jgi:two-component system, OmpR family, response regulator QseB